MSDRITGDLCDAEVDELHPRQDGLPAPRIAGEQHVARLHVAVHHTRRMRRLESPGYLQRDADALGEAQAPGLDFGEGRPLDELHDQRDPKRTAALHHADDLDDVWVLDRLEHAGFGEQSPDAIAIFSELRREDLDRGFAAVAEVGAKIDRARRAGAQRLDQKILCDDLSDQLGGRGWGLRHSDSDSWLVVCHVWAVTGMGQATRPTVQR